MKTIFTNQLHIFLLILLFNLNTQKATCQGPPLCFQYFFPTVQAQAGDEVTLPLMVRGFDLVVATQFGVYYDSSALELLDVVIDSSALPVFGPIYHNLVMPGRLLAIWNADSAIGVSMPDLTRILELKFLVKTNATGFFPVSIGDLDQVNSPYETVQMLPPDWRVVYLPLAQKIGGISIGSAMSDVLTATNICVSATSCNGSNGAALLEITGGQPPYLYHWEGPGGLSTTDTSSVSGLIAGEYWVTVTDQLNNSLALNMRINASSATIGTSLHVTQASSCGINNGCATITVNNGQAPYTYTWSKGASTGPTNCNLPSGQFFVTVTDALGCNTVRAGQVGTASELTLNLSYQHINNCSELGSAEVNPVGINGFQYLWSRGDTTRAVSGLAAGTYTVWVKEGGICQTKQTFEILQQAPTFNLNLSVFNIENCNGKGSAFVTPDGLPPFQYLWSTGATGAAISELPKGNYSVTVTGADGCIASQSFTVSNNFYLDWGFDVNNQCSPSDPNTGTIRLYYYAYEEGAPTPVLASWSNGAVHLPNTPGQYEYFDSLVGLPAGVYTVTVTDTEGCTLTRSSWLDCAQLQEPPPGMAAFYIKDDYLDTQYTIDSCAGVYAQNFEGIKALSFTLGWQTGAEFVSVRNFNLPGLNLSDFQINTSSKKLSVDWESQNSVSLPPQTSLFEVCLTTSIPWVSHRTISFLENPVDIKLVGGNGQEQAFIGKSGEILFNLYFPLQPSTIEAGILPPDCSADGNSQFCAKQSNPGLPMNLQVVKFNPGGAINWGYKGGAKRLSAGKYTITLTQAASESEKFLIKIPSDNNSNNCVWPGDADNNNAVNHYDLLFIGMAYGNTGHARPEATLDWVGQDAIDWDASSVTQHVNFKNADTNGDGTIDASDAGTILQNWGQVIHASRDNPFAAPANLSNNIQETAICLSKDTLEQGQNAILPVIVGSADAAQDSVYGLAFSIGYDPRLFTGEVYFVPADSWLGDVSDLLIVQKNDPGQGVIHIGITRVDGIPRVGWGAIGGLSVQVADHVLDENAGADTYLKTALYFNGINAVNAHELTQKLGGPPTEIMISRQTSAVDEAPGWEQRLAIYPNPTHALLNIASPEALLSRIEISDLMGRMVFSHHPDAAFYQISVQGFVPGVYVVRAYTKNGVCSKKIVINCD